MAQGTKSRKSGRFASALQRSWFMFKLTASQVPEMISPAEIRVLNDIPFEGKAREACSVATDLQQFVLKMKGMFMQQDGKGVDYQLLKTSKVYEDYVTMTAELQATDVDTLSVTEKTAFFLNVYNALTLHAMARRDKMPRSPLECRGFWRRNCYVIGGHILSLDDIEHGILRGNRAHPSRGKRQFSKEDPRVSLSLDEVDARIHFALVCGAKSCPPIQVFSPGNLHHALEAAACNFCQQEIHIDPADRKVSFSKIFLWYKADFGSTDTALVRWCLRYLTADQQRDVEPLLRILERGGRSVSVVFRDYDWRLNSATSALDGDLD